MKSSVFVKQLKIIFSVIRYLKTSIKSLLIVEIFNFNITFLNKMITPHNNNVDDYTT